jgi:DNA-binding PadR family transcriptional regulator
MRGEDKLLEGNLATILMALLSDGPSYGYALLSEAQRRSQGRLHIRQNALYPALHRLEADKFIAGEWQSAQRRRRRYYRLTPKGRKELDRRRARWREFSVGMNAVLKEVPHALSQRIPAVS